MNYYKRTFNGGAEYYASSGQPSEIIGKILQITVFWPSRYWIEHRIAFSHLDYERIDKKEFDYEYQRAIETFNTILKQQ